MFSSYGKRKKEKKRGGETMHSTKPLEEKLNLDDSQWEDIHVVTGALKMFFRELPEPLFPYCFFEQFVEAISKYITYSSS
ncbi:Rho GTPase-activating protein 15 [Varanus komodoensis]|nr:Rho GTPase-activating protein 15 [Varanus komodoensis]